MKKYPELHPVEKKYLENIFKASDHFEAKVLELREKHGIFFSQKSWEKVASLYTDTITTLRSDREVAANFPSWKYTKWEAFENDVTALAKYYYLQNYQNYLKRYILWRPFEPLSYQKILRTNEQCITLEIPYQISKAEFHDIWSDIECIKNSSLWKHMINKSKVKKFYKKDIYFDDKFFYYKENKYWEKLPDDLKNKKIEESNKYTWIREIEEAKNILVRKPSI